MNNSGHGWPHLAADHQPQPGHPAQGGQPLRPGDRRRGAGRGAECFRGRELGETVLLGELGLDGRVRPVRGILPADPGGRTGRIHPGDRAACARRARRSWLRASRSSAWPRSASWWPSCGASRCRWSSRSRWSASRRHRREPARELDLADVVGQVEAKWACEVAAAGRHHLLFARSARGRQDDARRAAAGPAARPRPRRRAGGLGRALAGRVQPGRRADHPAAVQRPPPLRHRWPASSAAVPRMAKPGAISCAHRGVLFLDEAPEFSAAVIEALRTPLESGTVTLGRSEVHARYPARFQLVMAANPCPCGQAATPGARLSLSAGRGPPLRGEDRRSDPGPDRHRSGVSCRCGKAYLEAALQRGETSAVVAGRVREARQRQLRRLAGTGGGPTARCRDATCAGTCRSRTACRRSTTR